MNQCFLWCRLRDSNPRPTVYKTVALPAELNRRRTRQWASSEGALAQGRASGGAGGDSRSPRARGRAGPRPCPGQGGMVIATKASGAPASARNWNAVPSGMVSAAPGLSASIRSRSSWRRQMLPRPLDDKPDFLDGAMGHRMRDGAGGQFEMRHAAAAKAQQQAHRGSVRRRRVGLGAEGLGFEGCGCGWRHRSAPRGSARPKPRSSWRGDRRPAKRGHDELDPNRGSGA